MIYSGIILISTFLGFFGFATLIKSNTVMIIVTMILRAAKGFSRTLAAIPLAVLVTKLESEQKIKYMGYLEAVYSIGDALGPIIGSILYKLVGFVCMFMIMGWFHFLYVPLMMLYMPDNIDYESEDMNNLVNSNQESSAGSRFSLYKLISNRLIILCSITDFLAHFTFSYLEPLLSFRVAEFTDSVFVQGFMYTLIVVGMSIMGLTISYL